MCENREEGFVVPVKRSAGMGWWLGQIIGKKGRFLQISILWVEVPECKNVDITSSTLEYVRPFEAISEAIACLASEGAFIATPI